MKKLMSYFTLCYDPDECDSDDEKVQLSDLKKQNKSDICNIEEFLLHIYKYFNELESTQLLMTSKLARDELSNYLHPTNEQYVIHLYLYIKRILVQNLDPTAEIFFKNHNRSNDKSFTPRKSAIYHYFQRMIGKDNAIHLDSSIDLDDDRSQSAARIYHRQRSIYDIQVLHQHVTYIYTNYIMHDAKMRVLYYADCDIVKCEQAKNQLSSLMQSHNLSDINSYLSISDLEHIENIYNVYLPSIMQHCIRIIADNYFKPFLLSKNYTSWRVKESAHAVATDTEDIVQASKQKQEFLEKGVLLPSQRYPSKFVTRFACFALMKMSAIDGEIPAFVRSQIFDRFSDFSMRAYLSIKPDVLPRLFGHQSWIASFLSAAEALPIGITLCTASVNPFYVESLTSIRHKHKYHIAYMNKHYEKIAATTRDRFIGKEMKELFSVQSLNSPTVSSTRQKTPTSSHRIQLVSPTKKLISKKVFVDVDSSITPSLTSDSSSIHLRQSFKADHESLEKYHYMFEIINKGESFITVLPNRSSDQTPYQHLVAWKPIFNQHDEYIFLIGLHLNASDFSQLSNESKMDNCAESAQDLQQMQTYSSAKFFEDILQYIPNKIMND